MVLMVGALAFTITSVLVGTSFFHLNFANRTANEAIARSLAEAAVARALERVVKATNRTETFGLPGKAGWLTPVVVTPAWAPEGATGTVVFSNALYGPKRLAWSTNNLPNDVPVRGFNDAIVPKRSVRLVGTGLCNDVRVCVEVYFHAPPFPYSIGSAGPVVSEGGLVVGSLGEGKIGTITAIPAPDDLQPGHLRSNAGKATAIKLGPNTTVSGNVESAGGIVLNAETKVKGTTKPYSGTNPLPQVEPTSYDPKNGPNPVQHDTLAPEGGVMSAPTLDGVSRSDDDLRIEGDLTLNGGVLYVNGNLTVTGGIKGKGSVICSGNMTVQTASQFEAKNQVALLAEGDMKLYGTGTDRSTVQGMMFCKGEFQSADLTLMGSLVKGGDPEAVVNVSNSRTVHVPEYTRLVLKPKPRPPAPNPGQLPYMDNSTNQSLLYNVGGMPPTGTTYFIGFWGAQANSSRFYNAETDSYDASGYDQNDVLLSFGIDGPGGWGQTNASGPGALAQTRSGVWAPIGGRINAEGIAAGIAAQVRANVASYNQQYQEFRMYEKGEGDYGSADFTFDVNEFLTLGDSMRQLLWRAF